ncbi:MAG TPA: S9 family peptidase [Verrucomicrobiae bacterium]|nr:S9 family peptidase [Verrucomicrobiae bacterium]
MNNRFAILSLTVFGWAIGFAQLPDNLVVEGVPPVPPELKSNVGRYLEFRAAGFNDWHPLKREMIITTRFADAAQLHLVKMPGGARRQLTFLPEPVAYGMFDPKEGAFVVFSQDTGGGEFYQLYRYDLTDGRISLLTDGKSRNTDPHWSNSGEWLAYSSTRRTGRDTDLYLMNPRQPEGDRLLLKVQGGGWRALDWSPDDEQLLLGEYISINESRVHLLNRASGEVQLLTPAGGEKVAWSGALFAKDGKSIFVVTDKDSEFERMCRLDLRTRKLTPLGRPTQGDVENYSLSKDRNRLALVSNEEGVSVLRLLDARTGKELDAPNLPSGVIGGLKWHANNRDLAFTLSSARSPSDVYVLDAGNGKTERWTESETGGLNPERFVEPELIRIKSFDGLAISGFLYRPDSKKFPGPRPVLVQIHGGPEGQSRPTFQARNNYYVNELGVAVLLPNVRGSAGCGKTFLTLDNGFKREDTVRDIGAFLDWIGRDGRLDAQRMAVIGGSYGGYMSLACMTHFSDRLRCGVDIVGISNFLTFMKNTADYRRDLRRVEYGDERDPAMAEFLGNISPANHAGKITKPLFVVQGLNDPRVPATQSQQMVKAIRDHGGTVWFLMAKDEGHGFQKKRNVDVMFEGTVLFLKENLLK